MTHITSTLYSAIIKHGVQLFQNNKNSFRQKSRIFQKNQTALKNATYLGAFWQKLKPNIKFLTKYKIF